MSAGEDVNDLWMEALEQYENLAPKRTYKDKIPFFTIKTSDDLEDYLNKTEQSFKLFREKRAKLSRRLKACMKPFLALSGMVSAAVSASPFAPASAVLGAVCFILKAAEDVSEVYDWIEQLFDKLGDFTVRLDHYVQQGLPQSLRNKIINILACLLEILACTETAIRDGRWKKYAAVLFLGSDERVKTTFDKLTGLFESEQSLAIAIMFATNLSMDKRMEEIGNTTENLIIATRDVEADRVRREILQWISTVDASGQQSDNLGRRQGNTGEWFLDNPTFKQWMSGSGQTWGLFCPGAPGAGKTTMSATVIHHLSIQDHPSNIAVAYLYCNYRSRNEQTLYNLLCALLRRLVQLRSIIPSSVLDIYNKFHKKSRLTLDQCTDLTTLACKEFSRVYVIIDALDECEAGVARALIRILNSVRSQANIHLLMTARFITSIKEMINDEIGAVPQLEVRASDSDIRQYFMSRRSGLPSFMKNNSDLWTRACVKVIEASGGM
jgi:hypothetical protein